MIVTRNTCFFPIYFACLQLKFLCVTQTTLKEHFRSCKQQGRFSVQAKNLTRPHPKCKIIFFFMSTRTMIRDISLQYHSITMKFDTETHRLNGSRLILMDLTTVENYWRYWSVY